MTSFPNFGLINQMSKHLANNTSPRVLDYNISDYNGYRYTPTSTDLITQPLSTNNSITQQQRFNAMAEQLMYNNDRINPIPENTIIRQGSVIDNLISPQQSLNTTSLNTTNLGTTGLNTTATLGRINDIPEKKESFIFQDESLLKETQNKLNIVGTIIVVFIVFMLIQLYLSQKKLEFMMNIYKPVGVYSPVLNSSKFSSNEVF